LQVVVLHPDHRAGLRDLRDGFGEPLIHPLVSLPPASVVGRLLDGVVIDRPQRRVREALVVVGEVLLGQCDGAHPYAIDVGQVGGGTGAAGPAHPGGRDVLDDRVQSADEPAGAASPFTGAVRR
jgi:hypothetical protein